MFIECEWCFWLLKNHWLVFILSITWVIYFSTFLQVDDYKAVYIGGPFDDAILDNPKYLFVGNNGELNPWCVPSQHMHHLFLKSLIFKCR